MPTPLRPSPRRAEPVAPQSVAPESGAAGSDATDARPPRTLSALLSSIRVGQAVITVVLLTIGAWRAVADGTPAALTVAVAVVFAGWYFGGLALASRASDRGLATWWLIGLALIWAGAVAVSDEFVWLAFPLWLLAGFVMRMRWAIVLDVVVLAVVIAAPAVRDGSTTFANIVGPLVGGIFAFGISRGYLELVEDARERRRLISSLVTAHAQTAALQDELARMQRASGATEERVRLSRDIHDTVAQSVSSIGMLARAALETGAPEQASRALAQIEDLARDGLADTRRIVAALMPAELEQGALADAIGRLLTRLRDETGISVELRADALPTLPTVTEVALLRTAQSALANVRTHSRATRVVVSLADAGDSVRLDVVDDGTGFDAGGWEAGDAADGGYGLRAMRARLRELGGGLDVESGPEEGTALSAHVPLGRPVEEAETP
jgi:signal transduction histidine kinase